MQEKFKIGDTIVIKDINYRVVDIFEDGYLFVFDEEGMKYKVSTNGLLKNINRNSSLHWCKGNPYVEYNLNIKLKDTNYKVKDGSFVRCEDICDFECKIHGYFRTRPSNVLNKRTSCPKCKSVRVWDVESSKNEYLKRGFKPLFDTYVGSDKKNLCIDKEGYKVLISLSKLLIGRKPQPFYQGNPYTLYNIELWLSKNRPEYELVSDEYISATDKMEFRCSIHNKNFTITWNKLKCGEGCYDCSIDNRSGENHPHYNVCLTDEERDIKRAYMGDNAVKKWREKVFLKDNYTCQCCGKAGGLLNAHHLDGWNWCVEGRHSISNGITLCNECHKDFHVLYGRKNNTYEQYLEYFYDTNYEIIN